MRIARRQIRATIEAKPRRTGSGWSVSRRRGDRVLVSCPSGGLIDTERLEGLCRFLSEVMATRVGTLELDLRRVRRPDTKLLAVLIMVASLGRKARTRIVIHVPWSLLALIQIYRLEHLFPTLARFDRHRELASSGTAVVVRPESGRLSPVEAGAAVETEDLQP